MARVLVPAHEEWTDDLDGSPAARSVELKTDQGTRYRVDLSKTNYADWIAPLVQAGPDLSRADDRPRMWRHDGRRHCQGRSPRTRS
jgi:hypothetical protein